MLAGPRQRLSDGSCVIENHPAFDRLSQSARDAAEPMHWVVIDDLFEDRCELAISPWPRLSDSGRLVFADTEDEYMVGELDSVEFYELVRNARAGQFPDTAEGAALIARPLRVGDTFAAVVELLDVPGEPPAGGHRATVRFPKGAESIVDVTADARVFAKVQAAIAEARPIEEHELEDLGRGLTGESAGPDRDT